MTAASRLPVPPFPFPLSASRGHSSARAVSGSHDIQLSCSTGTLVKGFSSSAGRAKGSRLPRQAGQVDRTDRLHSASILACYSSDVQLRKYFHIRFCYFNFSWSSLTRTHTHTNSNAQ